VLRKHNILLFIVIHLIVHNIITTVMLVVLITSSYIKKFPESIMIICEHLSNVPHRNPDNKQQTILINELNTRFSHISVPNLSRLFELPDK
jgi:hypothetical protein